MTRIILRLAWASASGRKANSDARRQFTGATDVMRVTSGFEHFNRPTKIEDRPARHRHNVPPRLPGWDPGRYCPVVPFDAQYLRLPRASALVSNPIDKGQVGLRHMPKALGRSDTDARFTSRQVDWKCLRQFTRVLNTFRGGLNVITRTERTWRREESLRAYGNEICASTRVLSAYVTVLRWAGLINHRRRSSRQ